MQNPSFGKLNKPAWGQALVRPEGSVGGQAKEGSGTKHPSVWGSGGPFSSASSEMQ